MNKERLYEQIVEFWNTLTNPSDRSSKTYGQAYLYVDDDNAVDKAQFIGHLISNGYLQHEYDTILDLTYGSGNLISHIVFDNDLEYDELLLNDINGDNSNQEITDYIDNCETIQNDILNSALFEHIDADLVILNPQIGGNYVDGDILQQKEAGESKREIFDKLKETIEYYLVAGSTVIFYGKKKDFDDLFNAEHYLYYMSELQQLFVVNNSLTETICFKKNGNTFNTTACDLDSEDDNTEIEDFDEIVDDLDKYEPLENEPEERTIEKILFSSQTKGNLEFEYKNLLFKGVPGTGKSRAIDTIITQKLGLTKNDHNVLRINIHSASSNSDLMQGIGISTNEKGNIKYSEKQGLVLDIIKRATFHPEQPFVLVLEEIQENSLNELIGDLIYLIEDDKRVKLEADDNEYASHETLINKLVAENKISHYVEIPFLVDDRTDYKKMIIPANLFIFCTSNYRDDKKIIEDNLLRRFEVIEVYPKNQEEIGEDEEGNYYFSDRNVSDFLENLNTSILEKMRKNHEIHPDRYMIGHAIWKDVNDDKKFYRAFSKLITEFKDIREIEFDVFKEIIQDTKLPDDIEIDIEGAESYFDLIKAIQTKIDYDFIS